MRRLKTELANKDAIIEGFEADRVQYQGTNAESLALNFRLVFILLTFCLADAIIKAKELAENVGVVDRLRNENIGTQVLELKILLDCFGKGRYINILLTSSALGPSPMYIALSIKF